MSVTDIEALNATLRGLETDITRYLERLSREDKQASQHWGTLGDGAVAYERYDDARSYYTQALRLRPPSGRKVDEGRIHMVSLLVESLHQIGELAEAEVLARENYKAARADRVLFFLLISTEKLLVTCCSSAQAGKGSECTVVFPRSDSGGPRQWKPRVP